MPCTIPKSYWSIMSCTCCAWCQPCDVFSDLCYFPSTLSDYIELHCTALRSDYIPHLHSDYIVKRSQVKSCFAASCLHLAFKFSALGFLTVFVVNFSCFFNLCLKSNYIRIRSDELLMTPVLWSGGFDRFVALRPGGVCSSA